MSFKENDTVRCIRDTAYTTVGKVYRIFQEDMHGNKRAYIIDDDGDENYYPEHYFVVNSLAVPVTTAQPVPSTHIMGQSANILICDDDVTITVDDDDDTYEQDKANARVTSTGLFEKGDVLVYLDGTPTLTRLTVVYCTATAVVFEETYSMPFNPAEFRRECQ